MVINPEIAEIVQRRALFPSKIICPLRKIIGELRLKDC